jgi:nucleoside-diphosphate-sugar epimerase
VKVLVVGGTGFVGPPIVRRLVTRSHRVAVFHRGMTRADLPSEAIRLCGDRRYLADYRDEFARFAPDVVLDTRPLTEEHARTVMSVFRGIAGRAIALSSGDVYRAYGLLLGTESGPLEPTPIREGAPLRTRLYPYCGDKPRAPADPMQWMDHYEKILVEREVLCQANLPGTILRLPMTYGPGDDQHRLFPYLKRMDDQRPAILLDEVHARWRWARGFVEDVAEAIVAATVDDRSAGRIYNVGEPDALNEADWVRAIAEAAGWHGQIVTVPRERIPSRLSPPGNFEQHLVYDTSRIRQELGYCEKVPRAQALARTVAWERAHPPKCTEPDEFDYAAEDKVLAAGVTPGGVGACRQDYFRDTFGS